MPPPRRFGPRGPGGGGESRDLSSSRTQLGRKHSLALTQPGADWGWREEQGPLLVPDTAWRKYSLAQTVVGRARTSPCPEYSLAQTGGVGKSRDLCLSRAQLGANWGWRGEQGPLLVPDTAWRGEQEPLFVPDTAGRKLGVAGRAGTSPRPGHSLAQTMGGGKRWTGMPCMAG